MEEVKFDKAIDLKAIVKQNKEDNLVKEEVDETELTKVIGNDWLKNINSEKNNEPIIPDDSINLSSSVQTENNTYAGPGMIIENSEIAKEKDGVKLQQPGLSKETMNNLDSYMKEFEEDFTKIKEIVEEKKSEQEKDNDEETIMTKDEFDRVYSEAVVVIDKTGMGTIINFTEEERQKLESVKKIRLEEIETVNLEVLKTKKKKGKVDTILKKFVNIHTTPIIAVNSGYAAMMKGCSAYELMSIMADTKNPLVDAQTKWTLIHSKIESTSIGILTYEDFLIKTAALDYSMFIYGILCATYPNDDMIPLTCEKCNKDFKHKYSIRSLIRAEKMSDKLKQEVASIVDASFSLDTAKFKHNNSPLSQVKAIRLPDSSFIVQLYIQSVYDHINKSIKELSENKDSKYNQASVLSSVVNKILIPDSDNDEYFEFDSVTDITKIIYSLSDTDILILSKQAESIMDGFEFGLMNITCPNCKHHNNTVNMEIEQILFLKYQQAMTTKIE